MVQTNLREIDMEDIDAKAYAEQLKDFGASLVLLNAAGIIASYDTKLPFQTKSSYLHGDSLEKIIEECHKSGIRVIARTDFSKVRYELFLKHPEWAYRTRDGNIVNYNGDVHVCPNGEYQQKYMLEILREVLSEYEFDGVFCNMSGFLVVDYDYRYYGPCHCESCRKKFKAMYGLEIPDRDDFKDPVYRKYMAFKARCIKQHKQDIYDTVHSIGRDIAINGLDYIRTESGTEIGRPQWQYSASMNSRLTSGSEKNRPADNAVVDYMGFRYRPISVSPAQNAMRGWQDLANAGSVSLYIVGRMDRHPDTSCFAPMREIFQFHKAHEELFTHMKSAAKVVLLHSRPTQIEDPEIYGWIRALTASHIPFDEIETKELKEEQLTGKEVLILGGIKEISSELGALIDRFAFGGGTVIASGCISLKLKAAEPGTGEAQLALPECFGIEQITEVRKNLRSSMFSIRESEKKSFPRCHDTPYIAPGEMIVTFQSRPETKGYMELVGEHPFGPPERCYFTAKDIQPDSGVSVAPFGKGQGIYIPWNCGTFYQQEGYQNTLSFMQDVLFELAGIQEMAPGLTPMVELTVNKVGEKTLIQLVNETGVFSNSYFNPVEIRNIELVLSADTGSHAEALRGGKVNMEERDGQLYLILDRLGAYEAIVIEG